MCSLVRNYSSGVRPGPDRALLQSNIRIDPEHLAHPQRAETACFSPDRYLPHGARERFLEPARNLLPFVNRPRAKRSRVHVLSGLHRALLDRFDSAGILELEIASAVPRGQNNESLQNGAFQVNKSVTADRLVLNRTTANSQEKPLGFSKWLFPHGSSFCDLILEPGEVARTWLSDLSNFYYDCSTSRARSLWNQFGTDFDFDHISDLECAQRLQSREAAELSGTRVQPLLKVVAMGDLNATCITQGAHLNRLRSERVLDMTALLSYRSLTPVGKLWHAVMVDDCVVVEYV
jgi:hypothetical protein